MGSKALFGLLGVFILSAGVMAGVYLVQRQQVFQERAAVLIQQSTFTEPDRDNYYGFDGTCFNDHLDEVETMNLYYCPDKFENSQNWTGGFCNQNKRENVRCFDEEFCGIQQLDIHGSERTVDRLKLMSGADCDDDDDDDDETATPPPTHTPGPTGIDVSCPWFQVSKDGVNWTDFTGQQDAVGPTFSRTETLYLNVAQLADQHFTVGIGASETPKTSGDDLIRIGDIVASATDQILTYNLANLPVNTNQITLFSILGTLDNPLSVPCYHSMKINVNPSASTPPPVTAICFNVAMYDVSWNLLSTAQIAQLGPGDTVRLVVAGSTTGGAFDKARFTVNGALGPEVVTRRPGSDDFYYEYTIPDGATELTVKAEIFHSSLGWF